jgi:hypothetical protein
MLEEIIVQLSTTNMDWFTHNGYCLAVSGVFKDTFCNSILYLTI